MSRLHMAPYLCVSTFFHIYWFVPFFVYCNSLNHFMSWIDLIHSYAYALMFICISSFFSLLSPMKVASNGVPPSISKRVLLRVQCKSKNIHSFHSQCTIRTYFQQIAQHFMNFKMEFNCSSATFPCSWFFCMWIWHYFVVHFRFSVPNVTMYLYAFFPLDILFFRLDLCSI